MTAPVPIDPQHRDTLHEFERSIYRHHNEQGLIFYPGGRVQFVTSDKPSYIYIGRELLNEMTRNPGCVFTHNHPGGWNAPEGSPARVGHSFSTDDLKVAINASMAQMRVVSPGYLYTLAPGKAQWSPQYWDDVAHVAIHDEIDEVKSYWLDRLGEVSAEDVPQIREQANTDHYHVLCERLAKRLGWDYHRLAIPDQYLGLRKSLADQGPISVPVEGGIYLDREFDTPIYTVPRRTS